MISCTRQIKKQESGTETLFSMPVDIQLKTYLIDHVDTYHGEDSESEETLKDKP